MIKVYYDNWFGYARQRKLRYHCQISLSAQDIHLSKSLRKVSTPLRGKDFVNRDELMKEL